MYVSEILWKASFALYKMIFKCAVDIIVKVVRDVDDYTEYTTRQYPEQYIPDCPAPRLIGCVQLSGISFIFLTHKPSMSFGEVWYGLDSDQKASARDQLEAILTKLRLLPYIDGHPLGEVAGEGWKDARRIFSRVINLSKHLMNLKNFYSQVLTLVDWYL